MDAYTDSVSASSSDKTYFSDSLLSNYIIYWFGPAWVLFLWCKVFACTALYCLVIFANTLLELAGERIWHHFTVGPVAHHHASPHQENHTGGRERPPLICVHEPLTVLHPSFFCLESLTSSLSANLSLWQLAPQVPAQLLCFFHTICIVDFLPFKSIFELTALKRLVSIDMNTKFLLYTVV